MNVYIYIYIFIYICEYLKCETTGRFFFEGVNRPRFFRCPVSGPSSFYEHQHRVYRPVSDYLAIIPSHNLFVTTEQKAPGAEWPLFPLKEILLGSERIACPKKRGNPFY